MQKSWFSKWVNNISEKYLKDKVSANKITIFGLILGLSATIFFIIGSVYATPGWSWIISTPFLIIGMVLFILSFTSDIFDGAVARLKEPTLFGGILDIFCDRFVELAILLSIVTMNPEQNLWPGILSISSIVLCITIFLLIGAAADKKSDILQNEEKKVLYYTSGIMERTETFLFLIAMLILYPIQAILLYVFAALVFFTALQRLYFAYKIFF